MKKLLLAVTFAVAGGVAVAADVIVPTDNTPFTVKEGDVVRISAKGIAGINVAAKVAGPAKHHVHSVTEFVKGRPIIGPGNHEVEVTPTGKGNVTVEVTITPPGGKAEVTKYSFKVQ